MPRLRPFPPLALIVSVLLVVGGALPAQAKDKTKTENADWLPITPEELELKDIPASPGAQAVILYRETHSDHNEGFERHYYRIKILTEEGKKHANVEIPFLKGSIEVEDIRARTIRPDGTVVDFAGTIFEKVVARKKRFKLLAKTFTLPDVQVGSIIEYRYQIRGERMGTVWMIDDDLFTRRARFSLRPRIKITFLVPESLVWNYFRLLPSQRPRRQSDGTVVLELENIRAFEEEEYAPPERVLKRRVEFSYIPRLHDLLSRLQQRDPDKYGKLEWKTQEDIFWKLTGVFMHEEVEEFIRKRKRVERAVAAIVSPGDSPETKLRKLYARAQQIRNTGYERPRTEKEAKRKKRKRNKHVEDVLKRGYGTGYDINRLFLALARAAGFRASMVWLAARSQTFFSPKILNDAQLNAHVVVVELDSEEVYLDPATRFCPFGFLSWDQTGARGIRVDENGGTFVTSPKPVSENALTERRATLRLDEEGTLEGELQVAFVGHEALERRLGAQERDELERRKSLEDEVKEWLPTGSEVTLENSPAWEETADRLQAEFSLKIPELAVTTGRRLLLPVAIFHTTRKHPFEHEKRRHPVYFQHPYREVDLVSVELPEGYEVETLPEFHKNDSPFGLFEVAGENLGRKLRLRRHLKIDGYYVPLHSYRSFRQFFSTVRVGDGEQAVLQSVEVDQQN